jgi:DNA repair ATPase RecN
MEQKTVKIISLRATNFGVLKALELDFEKFKNGFIAFKGNAGAGKSTVQNAIKTGTIGRDTLKDAAQYGEQWETETQLIDGEHKIFIGAKKKKDNSSIVYQLYEKDNEGKKVQNPIIDGVKATPSKYMELISTELTFGIKDFLSDNKTVHRNFMFALFRPELEKFGVIFDKKNPEYEKSILGELDKLTEDRDLLRSQCQHSGAFVADFEREGFTVESLAALTRTDETELTTKHSNLLVEKGSLTGNSAAEIEKKKSEVAKKGQEIIERIRKVSQELNATYDTEKAKFDEYAQDKQLDEKAFSDVKVYINALSFLPKEKKESIVLEIAADLALKYNKEVKTPVAPFCPVIENNQLKIDSNITYHADFNKLFEEHRNCVAEYMAIQPEEINYEAIDKKLEGLNQQIEKAKANNVLIDRYELNREWVEADAILNEKRQELAKLYAKVNTGVNGLKMKPFFNEEKMEIKTVYSGEYDKGFFQNEGEERLLLSYSSTQRPIIGVLLQVARLKKKTKMLPYIFIDDVPMDNKSREIIARIAEENKLTIITSMTGDYEKEKLTENEILIEGGEVFFNK